MESSLIVTVLKMVSVVGVVLGIVTYTVLAERRICAWMQDRLGPNRVGFGGLGQPIADMLKLLFKEDVVPHHVRRVYYILAPILVLIPSIVGLSVIPWGSTLGSMQCVIADVDAGILLAFAVGSLGVYGIVLGGWASNSKYPFLGGIRSSAQLISYEVTLAMSVVPVFMQAGGLRLGGIVEYQTLHGWLVWQQPLACFIFLVSAFAETNRLPFDLPEAEQELVSGYHTEYSGMKFALFFLAEYSNMVVASALLVTMFFGGWSLPFAPFNAPATSVAVGLLHIGVFLLKVFAVLFVYIWVRWTLPRFRYDQLMHLGWKAFFPLSLANIIVTAFIMAWRAQ
ncbi:MAG: NADH-quinone oxidoreductase subunit NuoH [Verrucomicrobia bacterium]|nr:NADH-quinone oxidoreductase subunit NuoH [Verrucomicrobiota bacterium]